MGTDTLMARDGRYNPVVIPRASADTGAGDLAVGRMAHVRLVEARGVYVLGELTD
jgi:hypothetical protein